MPSFNPRRFADPKALQSVSPEVLREFLVPHREFIEVKGFPLPDCCSAMSDFDYLMLTSILMTPDQRMSPDFIDALFFIHEMGGDSSMDDLLKTADKIGLTVPDESTAMDVAMRIWNADRDALEHAHSRRQIHKSRTFQHYRADAPMAFVGATDEKMAALESALDEWFISRKRGGNCKVFTYPGEDDVWFLVRHGDAYKRESAVEGYESKSVFFRPETFDVVCYVPSLGELRIHTRNKGELNLYRREFGKLIADDSSHFPGFEKYTLKPLIEDGERSLECGDIEGIDWILLSEVQIEKRTIHFSYKMTYSSPNVFAAMRHLGTLLSGADVIVRAKFTVKFSEVSKTRTVTITPPNKVQLIRDGDAELIELWLRKNGFIIGEVSESGKEPEDFLVGM
ncbi:MAG: hypothetical protein ACYC64_10345 [Armatimonadota bacterium]